MSRNIIFIILMCVCLAISVQGQQAVQQEKSKFVIVPDQQVLVTIAYQPGSELCSKVVYEGMRKVAYS